MIQLQSLWQGISHRSYLDQPFSCVPGPRVPRAHQRPRRIHQNIFATGLAIFLWAIWKPQSFNRRKENFSNYDLQKSNHSSYNGYSSVSCSKGSWCRSAGAWGRRPFATTWPIVKKICPAQLQVHPINNMIFGALPWMSALAAPTI